MPQPLLLEIGVEELPSSYVDAALAALPALCNEALAQRRIRRGPVKALGTPRRLAVMIDDVADLQDDLDEELIGPPEGAAYKDGVPTKAAEAFAQKLGVGLSELSVIAKEASGKQKAGRYLVGRRAEKGRPSREFLGEVLAEVCGKIPFRKAMRWGSLDTPFGRPVRWLLALYGQEVIDFSFAGARSGRVTYGHRFLAPGTFEVKSPGDYVQAMRGRHVLVDRDERARVMMERVAEAAAKAGGTYDKEAFLVAENASLVEEPHVVVGTYEPQFLALPAAVIRAVARGHQRYFCVEKDEDTLLPHYVTVVNTANRPDLIAKGNDRVMRARLSDAKFFYDEDRKVKIDDRIEKLAGIVFHNRLGSVKQKTERMASLAAEMSTLLGLTPATCSLTVDAARLCKFDLVSLMVGEFPELQGHMGRAYAIHAGKAAQLANAVRDHYKPVGASDAIADDEVSMVVALADRVDTLVGCFAVGLAPTGAADPYALRRACIAMLRTLIEGTATHPFFATLALSKLFELSYKSYDTASVKRDLDLGALQTKLLAFAEERLRGLLANATSNAVADATLAEQGKNVDYPAHAMVRAKVLAEAVTGEAAWLDKAKLVSKRLMGISKQAQPIMHSAAAFEGSPKNDKAIVELVVGVAHATDELNTEAQVRAALAFAETMATGLDAVFESTLVNDPDDTFTGKRLEVLSYGAMCLRKIADFSRL
jgi:glycyl-tRNA synthetase beta chain